MMQRLLSRIEAMANTASRAGSTWFAIVFAALLGFQLASYKYRHGDPAQLAVFAGMLLNNTVFLVTRRSLRIVLFISGTTLLIVGIVIMLYIPLRLSPTI
jgi:hypothetical protein